MLCLLSRASSEGTPSCCSGLSSDLGAAGIAAHPKVSAAPCTALTSPHGPSWRCGVMDWRPTSFPIMAAASKRCYLWPICCACEEAWTLDSAVCPYANLEICCPNLLPGEEEWLHLWAYLVSFLLYQLYPTAWGLYCLVPTWLGRHFWKDKSTEKISLRVLASRSMSHSDWFGIGHLNYLCTSSIHEIRMLTSVHCVSLAFLSHSFCRTASWVAWCLKTRWILPLD
jgi:hypothetical protein